MRMDSELRSMVAKGGAGSQPEYWRFGRTSAAQPEVGVSPLLLDRILLCFDLRKKYFKCSAAGAVAFRGSKPDRSMMPHDKRSRNPKAQSGALETFCCKKWIKYVFTDFFRDSRSVIMDRDPRAGAIAAMYAPEANGNILIGRRRLGSIANEIAEDLR